MQRKIHNQTLFVAALSVYLGLLIVGAPPQVLAQTFKSQEISKCTLENGNLRRLQEIKLVKPIRELANDLRKLIEIKKLDFQYDDSSFSLVQEFVETDDGNIYFTSRNSSNRWVDLVILDAIENLRVEALSNLPDFLFSKDYQQTEKRQKFEAILGKNSFEVSISFKKSSPEKAEEIVGSLTQVFAANACEETKPQARQVYENTKVTFENDQVFIVTRLPRAGLDASQSEREGKLSQRFFSNF